MAEQTIKWVGHSCKEYTYWIYDIDAVFSKSPANYVFAKTTKSATLRAIYIGETEDISERFGGLFYDNGWQYKGRPKRYKIVFRLEYLPLVADTPHLVRKAYYLIKPVIKNKTIESWELKPIPTWQARLPWL